MAELSIVPPRFVVLCGMAGRLCTLAILLSGTSSIRLLQMSQAAIAAGFAAHPALVAILFRSLPAESYARAVGTTRLLDY